MGIRFGNIDEILHKCEVARTGTFTKIIAVASGGPGTFYVPFDCKIVKVIGYSLDDGASSGTSLNRFISVGGGQVLTSSVSMPNTDPTGTRYVWDGNGTPIAEGDSIAHDEQDGSGFTGTTLIQLWILLRKTGVKRAIGGQSL